MHGTKQEKQGKVCMERLGRSNDKNEMYAAAWKYESESVKDGER
jgi:hypothetical protein